MSAVQRRNREYLYLALVLIMAVFVRIIDLPARSLWYDELQTVTFSILPLDELLQSVRAFDPHPPLYYLQLHFWMLFGVADWWIKLNSVIWSILALVMVYLVSRDLFDSPVALLAALIFALSPFAIAYAQEARMYAMLMFLGTGAFFFFQRSVERRNWWYLPPAMLFALGFLYTHGAGFMILVSLGSYALLILLESRFRRRQSFLVLLAALLAVLLLAIPWLRTAASISVGHALQPTAQQVADTIFILLAGFTDYPAWLSLGLVILFTAALFATLIDDVHARAIGLAFGLVPIVFALLVSYLYRPIWLYRTLAYVVPFWSILIAYSLSGIFQAGRPFRHGSGRMWVRYGLLFTVLLVLVHATLLQQRTFARTWEFKEASQFLRSAAVEGEVIYVPNLRVFWGMGWYLIGSGSVNPLTTTYSLTMDSGATLVSKPASAPPSQDRTDWLVYRHIDHIAPFVENPSDESVWEFRKLIVSRVEESE